MKRGLIRYKQMTIVTILTVVMLCMVGTITLIQNCSYDRCNENDSMLVYGYDGEAVTFFENSDLLHQMISYDDTYVYVGREEFENFLEKVNASGEVFIVFGGFYKMPGFVGIGYSCCYEPGSAEQVVKIPYEKTPDDWLVALVKML